MIRTRIFTILFILMAAGIFVLSSLPAPHEKLPLPQADKVFHFFAFILLTMLAYGTLRESKVKGKARIILWAITMGIIYGALDEIHQFYVPGRECSFWDWLADAAGAAIGAIVACKIPFIYRTRSEHK